MKPLDTCSVKYCFSPSSLLSFLLSSLLFSDSFSSSFPFLFFPRIFRHVIIYTSITDHVITLGVRGSHRVAFTLIRFSLPAPSFFCLFPSLLLFCFCFPFSSFTSSRYTDFQILMPLITACATIAFLMNDVIYNARRQLL